MKKMMAMLLASVMAAGTFTTTAFAYTGDDVQKNTSVSTAAQEADAAESANAGETDNTDSIEIDSDMQVLPDGYEVSTDADGNLIVTVGGKEYNIGSEKSRKQMGTVVPGITSLHFRSGPGMDQEIIGYLHSGDTVEIVEKCGDWYKVNFNGKTGYAHGKYLNVTDSAKDSSMFSEDALKLFLDLMQGGLSSESEKESSTALTPEGNMTLVDDIGEEEDKSSQQFITLVTKAGNTFYLIIDRDKDGNQNVLVGQIVTRIWPAATGDASVDKQRFERVEVPFTLEFQGDRVKQLLGPDTKFKRESGSWGGILLNLLPIVLILVILFFMFRAQSGGARGAMSFGKSRARLISPDKNKVTFKDVAGISEAKEEVWELVEFLRNPEKFRDLGATIPRGVLMVGAPGTGKTLLARAIAGESNASFYSISGSDFVEMFVGVGASRVRDMFEQAKRTAPSLIFIDEIDAVGRQRGYGMGGGNDEREQTLNALLVEMDGFENNSNVIVIAATNRADILDPALLRPGRFDRQVVVNLPDVRGREQILQVHARKVKMAPGVSFERIARGTSGFSGAQLANLVNEAALLAARKGLKEITEAELEEARDKVSWGRERRSLAINERGRRITAVHEAGHAICLLKTPHSEPLHRVTIVPRGGALGMTMWLPSDDKMHQLRSEMLDQLVVAMGGRCAEQIVFGDVTSGATGDIKSATNLARRMVCEFGMSEKLGLIEYGEHQGEVYIARDLGTRSRNYSESTAELIDSEVRFLVDSAYERAMAILTENRDKLDILTEALMEFETLEGSQVMDILEYGEMKNPPARVTPPPMPSEVEEQPGKDDSGHTEKKETEETCADGAEERKEEEKQEQAERDPSSCTPADESGMDGGEKK